MMRNHIILCSLGAVLCMMGLASADVFKAGGDRLAKTQNNDGGWDWPLSDANPKAGSATNILAPTAMGLVQAYRVNADPNHLAALKKAGTYMLSKRPQEITPEDGYLAAALDSILGGTKYADFVKNNFYTPLAAGTYDYFGNGGLKINTDWYIQIIRQQREHDGVANLAAFDCGIGLYAAHLVGADTSAWISGTKAEINELSPAGVYDVLGLAGAVLGLASVGEKIDPTTGAHAAASSLADLGDILTSYQLATGGFTWNGLSMKEGAANETVQETAFAVLALKELDSTRYLDQITKAAAYLTKVQLPTGGWEDFSGQGECNEVTGEALWAIGAAQEVQAKQPKAGGSAVPTP
jgi:hypothetical protein